ncbi:peptidoglycan-binding domain-containing protein [Jiella avicenniae]|uniref:Peptidoglycan-binding protein n=1 Tax=Jiella avicenniae TaxID=2907202 RepID=A0A9X1NVR5_9HYPH|nr:peptidoglycan-binding domain-containing protein [Jiella avicenniae]MCE7026580.1 peptidoglycan-binding protein [Jiella avicenniae]
MSSRAATGFLRLVARHPALSTGIAVFAVTATSVTVNGLYEQHGRHQNPMLATRLVASTPAPERFGSAATTVPEPSQGADETPAVPAPTAAVQQRAAAPSSLEETASRLAHVPAPAPRPLERPDPAETASISSGQGGRVVAPSAAERPKPASGGRFAALAEPDRVKMIQAALSSAQVASLTVDGVLGEKTRAAIRTFEALEGMDVTGEPEPRVLERLAEIGLVE